MQGGIGLPDARILPRRRRQDGATCATSIAPTSSTILQARRLSRSAGRGAGASWTSRPRSPRRTSRASRARTSPTARRSGAAPQLEQKAPGIDWGALLNAAQLGGVQKFDAYHFAAIPKLAALVGSEPLQNWKDWLAFHTLNQQANVLPKPFRDASFAFYGTALPGTPQQRPRDALALNATSNALQDAVGKAYVDKYFPASSKAEIQKMVDNIKAAFARRVRGDRLDGALDQAGSAEEGRRPSSSASAIPTRGATIRACRSRPTMPTPTRRTRGSPNTATRSRRSASRWTATNGGCRRSW